MPMERRGEQRNIAQHGKGGRGIRQFGEIFGVARLVQEQEASAQAAQGLELPLDLAHGGNARRGGASAGFGQGGQGVQRLVRAGETRQQTAIGNGADTLRPGQAQKPQRGVSH